MNGNANLNANNLTPQNVVDWRKKLEIENSFEKANKLDWNYYYSNEGARVGLDYVEQYRNTITLEKDSVLIAYGELPVNCWTGNCNAEILIDGNYVCGSGVTGQFGYSTITMFGSVKLTKGTHTVVFRTWTNNNGANHAGYLSKKISLVWF